MADDGSGRRVLDRMREIDRRTLAAAKLAKDAQREGLRKTWRDRKRRNRLVQVRKAKLAECDISQHDTSAEKSKQFQELFGDAPSPPPARKANTIRNDLVKLSKDRKAPASARVTALRTLAEMDGHIGKLQTQANETADQPLATMTRTQLEAELARLRAIVTGRGS